MNSPNRITPIVAGTLVMTLIQIIPVLNLLNVLCCSGILLGGLTGVYVYSRQIQNTQIKLTNKDGGMIGLLSGILSAILVSGFTILLMMFSKANPIAEIFSLLDQFGILLSPEVEEYLSGLSEEYSRHGYSPTLAIITFVTNIFIYPIFGTIGALIGVAIFSRKDKEQSNSNLIR
jgi:hypothetical protein